MINQFFQFISDNAFLLLAIFIGWQLGKQKNNHFFEKKALIFLKEKKFFILSIFLSGISLLGIFFFFQKTETSKQKEISKELDRKIYQLPEKPFERGLNLVFLADGYSSGEEFDTDIKFTLQGLKMFSPWKQYEHFNIYKIKPPESFCQIKTKDEIKPVLRCEEKINEYLNQLSLKRFRLIVLSRKDFQSWANVNRLKNGGIFFSLPEKIKEAEIYQKGILFAHLFGHSFGLKDEEKYVIAKAGGAPHTPDGPNCAPDKATAERWWGDLAQQYPEEIGYFSTCAGNESYIRPTKSSLMNLGDEMDNFNPSYGLVSEIYLAKILKYCFSSEKITLKTDPQFFEMYPEFKECW